MARARRLRFEPRRCLLLALAICLLPLALAAAPVSAQQPPARDLPTPDQLEPGVNTSPAMPPAVTPGSAVVNESAAAKGSIAAKESSAAKGTTTAKESAPAKGSTAGKGSTAAQATPVARTKGAKGTSRLELDATEITGNRELPKVLYIVPWKRSDLGELVGRPVNSLLDEVLEPLDRDVFQRENRYYNGLKGAPGPAAAGASPAAETKP